VIYLGHSCRIAAELMKTIRSITLSALESGLPKHTYPSHHFVDRLWQRFGSRPELLGEICKIIRDKQCELVFECVMRGGQVRIRVEDASVIVRYDDRKHKLVILTIY